MAPNMKSVFSLPLALILLLAMTLLTLNIPTEAQAKSLEGFNPQSTSRLSLPASQSSDDDDDHGDENDNGDGGGDKNDNGDDGGGKNDSGDDGDDGDEDSSQSSPSDDESSDDGDEDSPQSSPSDDESSDDGDEDSSQSSPSDDESSDDGNEDSSQPSPSDDEPSNDNGGENTPQASPPNNKPSSDDNDNDEGSSDTSTPHFVNDPRIFNDPGPKSDRDVVPVFYDGNPQGGDPNTNCGFFNTDYREFRISKLDSTGSGNYSDGILSIDIVVTLSPTAGPSFDWSIAADSLVKALPGMFVKGGSNGNWYDYSQFTDVSKDKDKRGATYDGMMHSPINPTNGKFYGLSHVSFCYRAPSQGETTGGTTGGETTGGIGGGTIDGTGGGTAGVNVDTSRDNSTSGGTGGDVVTQIFAAWVPAGAAVDQTTDGAPLLLPTTGIAQIWDYPFIVAALVIGGLSLAVVSLHSYLLAIRPDLYDRKKRSKNEVD